MTAIVEGEIEKRVEQLWQGFEELLKHANAGCL